MKKNLRPQQAAPVVRASAGNSKESQQPGNGGITPAMAGMWHMGIPFAGDDAE